MKKLLLFLFIIQFNVLLSQNINVNDNYINEYLRTSQLLGNFDDEISFTIRPIVNDNSSILKNDELFKKINYSSKIFDFFNEKGSFHLMPINYSIEFNSRHPLNRNNGSMIPNRGYQHVIGAGFFTKVGPLQIQIYPEHIFAENKDFEGFGEGDTGHYPIIWAERYNTWNHIDIPERFGEKSHNNLLIGQSSITLNFKGLRFGVSNENVWWGPAMRNSIMLSNNSRGFKHITFNSTRPHDTKIGKFEWQIISGRLESSGYTPPKTDFEYAGTKLYIPKINQNGLQNDWRYIQGLIL